MALTKRNLGSLALAISVSVSLLVGGAVSAQMAPDASASSLASAMKSMSAHLKKIVAQAKDPSKNASSAQLSDELVKLVELSRTFVPDTVSSLPKAQQPERLALYQKMIDDTALRAHALGDAFRADDNAKAVDLLRQLADDKKTGHDEFK